MGFAARSQRWAARPHSGRAWLTRAGGRRRQAQEREDATVAAEVAQETRLQGAVEAGLAEARQRVPAEPRAAEARPPAPPAAAPAGPSAGAREAGSPASAPAAGGNGRAGGAAQGGLNGAAERGGGAAAARAGEELGKGAAPSGALGDEARDERGSASDA